MIPPAEKGSVVVELAPELGPDGRPTAAGWRWIGRRLREPMPARGFRGKGGREMRYITARQVQARLDQIVGPGNWSSNWTVVRAEPPVIARVGIAIFGNWKWDTGYSNNPEAVDEFIPVTDESGNPVVDKQTGEVQMRRNPSFEEEPLKAAVSDGFKRAAVQHGVGRWLYPEIGQADQASSDWRTGGPMKQRAQAALEYALVLSVVSLGSVAALQTYAERLFALYASIDAALAALPIAR
jgi:hypothetical protein